MSILGKVYCQLNLNCMQDIVDDKLHEGQIGCRPKKSYVEQILFTLHHIIEECQEF